MNGKSYVGQSIHCGKRLDEHSKGNQLIDEIIQLEGIENFNFEILKEVERNELNYWEDYFIIKYETMFPSGYNKKWNSSVGERKEIEQSLIEEKTLKQHDEGNGLSCCVKKLEEQKNPPSLRKILEGKCSMKFFIYLLLLNHGKDFRQKNLSLTDIKRATGITDAAAKQYLYQLEHSGLIEYVGEVKDLSEEEIEIAWDKMQIKIKDVKSSAAKDRIEAQIYGAAIWKKRNKEEKNGIYYIRRPTPWTPIPEETLQFLNEYMQCSEFELKIYLWCVSYNDICNASAKALKPATFDDIRTELGFKNTSSLANAEIRRTLILLQGLGLLDFQECFTYNRKGVKIPNFLIKSIGYYVDYNLIENQPEDLEDIDNEEIRKHIEEIYSSIKNAAHSSQLT